ncbi:MAG: GNAT family N-acetyltransferase [Planctomycetota bacterium]|nr:MAG: GNAT family N-acetyltransferase [Planctomycetota bacterium]
MTVSLAPALQTFPVLRRSGYRLRLAQNETDLRRVQSLRYQVFNLELNEGFPWSHDTGLDQDAYDRQVHHLMVEHEADDLVVGTYRLQTLSQASCGAGYYTAEEYDLSPMRDLLPEAVEASRACVLKGHRDGPPIQMLWRGIARYMQATHCRYLFGLCSLTSQDAVEGIRAWQYLADSGMIHDSLRVHPHPGFECAHAAEIESSTLPPLEKLPPLFDAYMRIATRIAGYPAIDRAFRTIDFLALLDLEQLPNLVRRRFLR